MEEADKCHAADAVFLVLGLHKNKQQTIRVLCFLKGHHVFYFFFYVEWSLDRWQKGCARRWLQHAGGNCFRCFGVVTVFRGGLRQKCATGSNDVTTIPEAILERLQKVRQSKDRAEVGRASIAQAYPEPLQMLRIPCHASGLRMRTWPKLD